MKNFNRRDFLRFAALTGVGAGISMPLMSQAWGSNPQQAAGKRVGIIGLDTSHAVAFAKSLNSDQAGDRFKGFKIVAAYPQGSKDIKSAVERVPKYIEQVKGYGVKIVSSIDELLKQVDVVLLESNDGRVHLEQAIPVINAKKPVFIDKPIAASYKDAKAIFDLAAKNNVPVFSSSSLRYMEAIQSAIGGSVGAILGANTFSPATIDPTHPDMFWYGIHGVEMLFTLMGTGCESVTRFHTEDADVIVGRWKGNRVGTFRGTRKGKSDYGGTVFGEKGNITLGDFKGYDPLLEHIVEFFDTGVAPVNKQETLEICAFIEAADLSKNNQGKAVSLSQFLNQ